MDKKTHNNIIEQRKRRVRSYIRGTETCPRLSVHKSNTALSLQAIDDEKGITIASATEKKKKDASKKIAQSLAKQLTEKKIEKVVFDRGQYRYHGLVKDIAETLRSNNIHV